MAVEGSPKGSSSTASKRSLSKGRKSGSSRSLNKDVGKKSGSSRSLTKEAKETEDVGEHDNPEGPASARDPVAVSHSNDKDTKLEKMEQELLALREQVKFCQRIEIRSVTNEMGDASTRAVLAQGQLEDGKYESGGNLFRIKLKTPEGNVNVDGSNGCPLIQLCNLRVTVGGLHQGQLSSITDFRADFDTLEGNTDSSKGVLVIAQSQQLAVLMVIHGWPMADWFGVSFEGLNQNHQQAQEYLSITLPKLYPKATVTFDSVYLFSDVNQGAIRNLPTYVRSDLEKGLEESQSKFVFMKLVTNRMRFVLEDNVDGELLVPKVQRVIEGLAMLDIKSLNDLNLNQNKQTFEYIIQMFKISEETGPKETFENSINGLLLQKQRRMEGKRNRKMTS